VKRDRLDSEDTRSREWEERKSFFPRGAREDKWSQKGSGDKRDEGGPVAIGTREGVLAG